MAGVESSAIDDELESYFTGFNDLLQQLESCADNLVTEYLERKLEDCVSILFGMICQLEIGESTEHRNDVLEPLKVLYELSYEKLEEISQKIIMEQASIDQGSGYYVPLTYLPTLPVLPGVSKFFIKSPGLPVRPPNLPLKSNRGVFFINVVACVAGVIVGSRLVKFWATAKPRGEWGGGHEGIKQ